MTISTAVVGYGIAGRVFHAPLIAADPAYRLDTLLTASPERAAAAAADHPDARVVPDLDSVLDGPDVPDLVVIATPHETHVPFTRRALDAGADVVVDKPIATRFDEAAELVEHAARLGRRLTVFQNRR